MLAPFAALPLDLSFWVHTAIMLVCAIAAGAVGARAFGLPRGVGVLSTLAWAPITGSIAIGQNVPLALLLASLAILGLIAERPPGSRGGRLTAAAIGLLLYKPTLALPLAGLLVLRARWTDVAIVVLSCLGGTSSGSPLRRAIRRGP